MEMILKQALGWPLDPLFYIPDNALAHFHLALENGREAEAEWGARFLSTLHLPPIYSVMLAGE